MGRAGPGGQRPRRPHPAGTPGNGPFSAADRTAPNRVLGLWCLRRTVDRGLLLAPEDVMRLDETTGPTAFPLLVSAAGRPTVEQPDAAALEAHMARRVYGRFTLTDAVRPGWRLDVVPQEGYRHDSFVDPQSGTRLPALVAAVSSESLFETFLDLLVPLGDTVDVVLESSHATEHGHEEFVREGVERVILESLLWEFDDLLLNDGCTGIAVMRPEASLEVQLDEHKLLVAYAPVRGPFERILRDRGLGRDDRLRFISQGEHLHTSHGRYARRFEALRASLGAE